MSRLSITSDAPAEPAVRRPWGALWCAIAGLALNAVALPIPFSGGVAIRLGGAASLVVAALLGPLWGLAVAAVAAAPLVRLPAIALAQVVVALAAGMAVRRGHFVSPVAALAWLLWGLIMLATLGAGDPQGYFGAVVSGLVCAVATDAITTLPAVGRRYGSSAAPRDVASHLELPFVVAAAGPALLAGIALGSGSYDAVLGAAAAGCGVAIAASRVLGRRASGLLRAAYAPTAKPSAADRSRFVAVDEIARLTEAVAALRTELTERGDDLERRLAERERAYEELLHLSESLEERLQLRGVEVEQRTFLLSLSQRHYRDVVEHTTDIIFSLDLEGRLTSINTAGERFFGHDQGYLLGRSWTQTLAPGYDVGLGEGDAMHAILEELHAAGRADTMTVHSAAGQEVRILATRLELIRDEVGLPVSVSGVARDVTELDGLQRQVRDLGQELQALRRRDRRRDREMNSLLTAARVLNSELEIDQLLQHVIESAAAQIGAESGFVGLLEEGALTLRWYWRSTGASWVDLEGPGVERGIAEIVLDTRRPYYCANAEEDPHTDKEFTTRFGIRSMLVFPIFSQESELIGAMALHNFPLPSGVPSDTDDIALDPSDTRFLEGLADVASAAIQQTRLFEKVRQQAETDPLTGLFNRRAFDERFDSEIERAARFNRTFALLLLDIDHLKKINDTYGHPIGDAAICTVADVLQSRLRRHDFAARIGGEEFAVLVVEGRSETAAHVARSLLDSLRKRDVPRAGHITASLGVAVFPEDANTRDELFRVADNALYGAKNSGRNRVMLCRDLESGEIPNPS